MICTCDIGDWTHCPTCRLELMLKKCTCHIKDSCLIHQGGYNSLPIGSVPPRERLEDFIAMQKEINGFSLQEFKLVKCENT